MPDTHVMTIAITKTTVGKVVHFRAELGNILVGVLTLTVRPNEIRLCSLFVVPEHRKKKIATNLLAAVLEAFIPQMGEAHKPVYLEADSFEMVEDAIGSRINDDQLRKFYLRFGFISVLGHPFAMVRNPVDKLNSIRNN